MTGHVNERRRLEKEILKIKNLNKSLESFTSTISHEYRTPLGISLIFLEQLIEQNHESEHTKRILDMISTNLNLLLSLVNDVLDLKMI